LCSTPAALVETGSMVVVMPTPFARRCGQTFAWKR
jgi:hypothetical protein